MAAQLQQNTITECEHWMTKEPLIQPGHSNLWTALANIKME